MQVEYVPIGSVKPYSRNAKKHPDEQVEHIANSIREFGWQQPIVVDKDGVVVIGHGRLLAAKKLGYGEVPIARTESLSEEQIKALRLADNKTNESPWDFELLELELNSIELDMGLFGFDAEADDNENEGGYTRKADIPQYDIKGGNVSLDDLVNREKTLKLIEEIESSNVSEDEKVFLKTAARRHYVFNYKKIAEYYAQASEEMQDLMEKSALVIIDYDNAMANGYVKLSKKLEEIRKNDS